MILGFGEFLQIPESLIWLLYTKSNTHWSTKATDKPKILMDNSVVIEVGRRVGGDGRGHGGIKGNEKNTIKKIL